MKTLDLLFESVEETAENMAREFGIEEKKAELLLLEEAERLLNERLHSLRNEPSMGPPS